MPKNDRVVVFCTRDGWRSRPGTWCPKIGFFMAVKWLDYRILLRYMPRRGYRPYEATRGFHGPVVWRATVLGDPPVKKRVVGAAAAPGDGPQHLAAIESVILSKLHPIVKSLAVVRYDDGDPRTPGKLFIETMGSAWKATMTDPDTCAKLQVVAQTLDDALSLLSLLLEAEDTPWEIDQYAMARAKAARKK